jgi:hypothetical protein
MRKRKLTKQIGVLLSEETYQLLFSVTNKLEISISELIRKMIEEKLITQMLTKKIQKEETQNGKDTERIFRKQLD